MDVDQMSGMAANLAALPDTSEEGKTAAELQLGLRCHGCKERIQDGWELIRYHVLRDPSGGDGRMIGAQHVFACGKDGCGFLLEAAPLAVAFRRVKWMFTDDPAVASILGSYPPQTPGQAPAEATS